MVGGWVGAEQEEKGEANEEATTDISLTLLPPAHSKSIFKKISVTKSYLFRFL